MKVMLVSEKSRLYLSFIVLGVLFFTAGFLVGQNQASKIPPAVETGYRIQVLNDRDYYPVLLKTLSKANKSIHIAMFLFKSDTDVVEKIVELLITKSRQGVDVKVVLEDSQDVNELTYRRLLDGGVSVKFDSRALTTHSKIIIVDGKIVIVGSHNFTFSAMERNHEASVMIISQGVAEIEEEYFQKIWSGS
ncbi:MAG: phospholipase [Thermoprotei archaeon]|nr:MAG: phospholipase [Thermoprotei archaeon]